MTGPTYLGRVGTVAGSSIGVRQAETIASGTAIIGGRAYRVGQVGSFVRIPLGYHDLYGIIAEVGANATPEVLRDEAARGERWMTVQLVGEIVEVSFERGISQYPSINDEVHLVTEDDLSRIYAASQKGQIQIGRLAGAESIPVRLDLTKLVTRHSAVLGSTGSGKSTSVTSLLRSICEVAGGSGCASARVLLLDIHGEYAAALGSVAAVFRVNPSNESEKPLHVPYWALDPETLLDFLMGNLDEKAYTAIRDKVQAAKLNIASDYDGVDENSLTVNTPLPFSLKKLWSELLEPEIKTWADQARTIPAIVTQGDPETLTPPTYQPHSAGGAAPFLNSKDVLNIRKQLAQMRSRLLDRQYDFMLHPGEWEPDLDGKSTKDLPDLLEAWFGHDRPITVLDLSGIPSHVLVHMIGGILNITYEAMFWGRALPEGGRQRPTLVVMEEAHRYLGKEPNPARDMVQRIVKEGRKFGVGAMIVSQRPSEIDETILSQCGTLLTLRLSNTSDRAKVQAALPDSLAGLVETLPILRTGEAIVMGEAASIPIRCRITLPPEGMRPTSEDPEVAERWSTPRGAEDYKRLAAAWRSQDPRWDPSQQGGQDATNSS